MKTNATPNSKSIILIPSSESHFQLEISMQILYRLASLCDELHKLLAVTGSLLEAAWVGSVDSRPREL